MPNSPKTYKKRLDHHTCEDTNLDIIARNLEQVKANNSGVTPYSAISKNIVKLVTLCRQ